MSKNELSSKNVKELETICKENGITYYVGKKHLTKNEMIEKIENATCETKPDVSKQEEPIQESEVVEEKKEWEMNDKTKYIEEAEVGCLIAFYDEKGKPRTAALVNRSSARQVIKVITEFGWEFIVPYEKVLWVRKGNRWPKPVYEILKGYNKNGKENVKK